jgi:hypothetical protein
MRRLNISQCSSPTVHSQLEITPNNYYISNYNTKEKKLLMRNTKRIALTAQGTKRGLSPEYNKGRAS